MEDSAMSKNSKAVRSKKHARLHRSFLHLSKALKKFHGRGPADANGEPSSSSSATSFLSGCMHPRTHSFAASRRRRHPAARPVQDDDDALAVNFRSLRVGTTAVVVDEGSSSSAQDYYSDGGSGEGEDVPAAAAAAKAAVGDRVGVAVVTLSAVPYEDFRRSMREMVDAARREAEAGSGLGASPRAPAPAVDWDLMEELLFCYLELNDRAVHKDILRAFTDTVAALRRRRRAAAAKSRRTRRRKQRRAREDGRDDAEPEKVDSL